MLSAHLDAAIQAGQCAKGLVPDVNSLPLWSEVGQSDRVLRIKAPSQLGNKVSLVSEAFCVAFQMSVEVKGKVRRGSTLEQF